MSIKSLVAIVSDADNDLIEAIGENNNVVANPIDIELAPYADLDVSNVTAPNLTIDDPAKVNVSWTVTNQGTNSGQPITVNWLVTNSGIGLTNTSEWSDRLYLASDPEGKNIVKDLGSFDRVGALAVGKSYNRSVQVTTVDIPQRATEVNNRTASPNPLNVTVEELNLGVVKETTLSTGQSRLYQIEVGAGETLRVKVDSSSLEYIGVTFDGRAYYPGKS